MYETRSGPVILVGAHRSGTSAVTERLVQFGLFVGARVDSHAESTFFQRLNRRLSNEAGGHWTNPLAVRDSLTGHGHLTADSALDARALDAFVDPLRRHLHGPAAVEFWGLRDQAARLGAAWGWKDPRNTYLYPLWSAVYPDRKLVSIQRDPLASARSLVRRTGQVRHRIETESGGGGQLRRATRSLRGNPILADGWRTMDLSGALAVALDYREMQADLARSGDGQLHIINYEELVATPADVLADCAAFCGLTPTSAQITSAAATIHDQRDVPRSEKLASKPSSGDEGKGMHSPDHVDPEPAEIPDELLRRREALGYAG